MKKIKIKEESLRRLVKSILLETEEQAGSAGDAIGDRVGNLDPSGVGQEAGEQLGQEVSNQQREEEMQQAYAELEAFEEIDMEDKILNNRDTTSTLSFYFRHTVETGCPGELIKDYGTKLYNYITTYSIAGGFKDPGASDVTNHIVRMERILQLVGSGLVRKKISRSDLSSGSGSIVTLLYNAMEATTGGSGLGTDDEGIEIALNNPAFKYSIEGLSINKEYKLATPNKEWLGGFSRFKPEPDLFEVFLSEYGNENFIKEKGNVRQYILSPMIDKPYCRIFIPDSDAEKRDLTLQDMFKVINEYAKKAVEGDPEEEDPGSPGEEEELVVDIESDDPESEEDPEASDSEEIDGVEPPGERRRRDSSRRERRERSDNTDRIKGEIIRLIEPKRLQTGMPKFEDLFDVRAFQRSIVAGMREDRRGFGNGQDFNIEISFNNDGRISRNFSPVGFGQFRIGGKMLRKAKKSRNWKGSLKKIFADALDDALAAKDTEVQDLLGIKRLRIRIIIPAGFYELNESRKKVFLKGKDILKIIKRL